MQQVSISDAFIKWEAEMDSAPNEIMYAASIE